MSASRGSVVNFYPKDLQPAKVGIVTAVNADGSVNMAVFAPSGAAGAISNVAWFDTVQPAPTDKNDALACPLA